MSRVDLGFAEQLLTVLETLPGAREHSLYLDEFGVHPYSDSDSPIACLPSKVRAVAFGQVDGNFCGIWRLVSLLDKHGLTATPLWIGEYGFSTTDTWMKAVPDSRRALFLMLAADLVRDHPRIAGLVWYVYLPSSADGAAWALAPEPDVVTASFAALRRANSGPTATVLRPRVPQQNHAGMDLVDQVL